MLALLTQGQKLQLLSPSFRPQPLGTEERDILAKNALLPIKTPSMQLDIMLNTSSRTTCISGNAQELWWIVYKRLTKRMYKSGSQVFSSEKPLKSSFYTKNQREEKNMKDYMAVCSHF